MSKTTIIEGKEYKKAKIRKDLLEEQVAVPVGKNYYSSPEPLPYRWKDDEDVEFEIFMNGKWHLSESNRYFKIEGLVSYSIRRTGHCHA